MHDAPGPAFPSARWDTLAVATNAPVVFWDGGCGRCTQLVALGKQAGMPTRLVRVPQGELAHL